MTVLHSFSPLGYLKGADLDELLKEVKAKFEASKAVAAEELKESSKAAEAEAEEVKENSKAAGGEEPPKESWKNAMPSPKARSSRISHPEQKT